MLYCLRKFLSENTVYNHLIKQPHGFNSANSSGFSKGVIWTPLYIMLKGWTWDILEQCLGLEIFQSRISKLEYLFPFHRLFLGVKSCSNLSFLWKHVMIRFVLEITGGSRRIRDFKSSGCFTSASKHTCAGQPSRHIDRCATVLPNTNPDRARTCTQTTCR